MPQQAIVISCKSAAEPLDVGHFGGYQCKLCRKELQVSPTGRLQIDMGAFVVCNACGFDLATEMARRQTLAGFALNPAAQRTLEKRTYECDVCGVAADRYWTWRTRPFCLVGLWGPSRARLESVAIEGKDYAEWGLCESCRPLWEARDAAALAARADVMHQMGVEYAREWQRVYAMAMDCIQSGPTILEVVA